VSTILAADCRNKPHGKAGQALRTPGKQIAICGMYLFSMGLSVLDADLLLNLEYESATMHSYWSSPEVDRLAVEQRAETDPDKRRAIFAKVWQIDRDNAVFGPLYNEIHAYGMRDCVSRSPKSATGVLLVLGDMLHHNDNENATPASKNALDVLASIEETALAMIAGLARCIEIALLHHSRVVVSILRGNHDRDAYLIVLYSLAERYRNHPRIDVQRDEGEFFVIQHGKCLLAAHHGDKAKPERLVMALADEFPQLWGETRHRFYYTGHLHHHKSADIGGVQWEQLRAVTKRDRYAKDNAYTARSQMQAITFDDKSGEVSRVKINL